MGFLETLLRPKAALNPMDDRYYASMGAIGAVASSGAYVNAETALTSSMVWACTRLISESIAMMPTLIYRRLTDGGKERASGNPLYTLLHDAATAQQTAFTWKRQLMVHALLWGGGYARIQSGARGPVDSLPIIHPDSIRAESLTGGGLRYQVRGEDGIERPVNAEDVFHLPGLSLDGVNGLSLVQYARESIGLALSAEGYSARFYSQDARPGGILKTDQKLSPEAAERSKLSWQLAHSGAGNWHTTAVLDSGLEWQQLGMTHADAELIQQLDWSAADIARFFNVPLHMVQLMTKTTSWGCLPAETPIFTTGGPVPISRVEPGTVVWSLGEKGLVPSVVKARIMNGFKSLMTIKTKGRTLRLTDNHRLIVCRWHGKASGRRRGQAEWVTEWIRADQVQPGDYLAVPNGLPAGQSDRAPNGRTISRGLAELLGLYVGDGSRDNNRIEIAHAKDADYLDYYRQIIENEFGVKPYTDKRGTRTRWSSVAAIELLNCGFEGLAHTKRVPSWVFHLQPDLQLGFLRGFLDADGCIQHGRINFSSCNHDLLEDMRHLCMQVGVPVGRVHHGRSGGKATIRGRMVTQTPKYHLNASSLRQNGKIGSNSPAKAANLELDVSDRALSYDAEFYLSDSRNGRKDSRPAGEWLYPGLCLQKVSAVTPSDGLLVPVYDLSVENAHSFIADGVLVHNSGIEEMGIEFVVFTLMPWIRNWEQLINKQLILAPQTYFAEFLVDSLMRGKLTDRYNAYGVGRNGGWLSVNEIRSLENLNPVPGGDEYLRPMNMTPAGAPATAHYRLLVHEAAARIVRKEIAAMSKAAKRNEGDEAGWADEVRAFYSDHHRFVSETLGISPQAAGGYVSERWQALLSQGPAALDDFETDAIARLEALAMGEHDG